MLSYRHIGCLLNSLYPNEYKKKNGFLQALALHSIKLYSGSIGEELSPKMTDGKVWIDFYP